MAATQSAAIELIQARWMSRKAQASQSSSVFSFGKIVRVEERELIDGAAAEGSYGQTR